MVEIDGDLRKALQDFLRIYGVRDYFCKLASLCLYTLLTLGTLGVLIYKVGENRFLKLGFSICLKLHLNLFVALQWQYRAKCTEKKPCTVHSFECIQFEGTGGDWVFFFIGILFWLVLFLNLVMQMFATATAKASMIDFPAINRLFGEVQFTDGGFQDMLKGHICIIIASAVVCVALTTPGIVCMLQCIHSTQALVTDLVFACGIWTCRLMILCFCLISLVKIFDCCCCDNIEEQIRTVCTNVKARSKTVCAITKATSILPPTTAVKADKHNIATIADIAEAKTGATKYSGKYKMRPALLKHFKTHCTVDGNDATEKHIEAAFAKANILYDNDGLRLFLIKELGTLSLL